MTLTIDLTPEQEATLTAEAERTGQTVEEYALRQLLGGHTQAIDAPQYRLLLPKDDRTPEQRAQAFAELQAWLRANAPSSPAISLEDLTREAMYADRGLIDADE